MSELIRQLNIDAVTLCTPELKHYAKTMLRAADHIRHLETALHEIITTKCRYASTGHKMQVIAAKALGEECQS